MTAAQTLASRLLLAVGALALAACSDSGADDSSTRDCSPPVDEKCVSLDVAWGAARSGPGGASGDDVPAACPALADIPDQATFIDRIALSGSVVTSARTDGDQCCYRATYVCEGRPFVVEGALRTARLRGASGWG